MTVSRQPPRFVPTLTTVADVPAGVVAVPQPIGPGAVDAIPDAERLDEAYSAVEEALVQRVLERLDRSLEDQISDVVASEVQAQLDVMVPRLRSEIEKVLRRLVTDSLARERVVRPVPDPGSTLV